MSLSTQRQTITTKPIQDDEAKRSCEAAGDPRCEAELRRILEANEDIQVRDF